jgi:transglutaminase-like putative cysteine protease
MNRRSTLFAAPLFALAALTGRSDPEPPAPPEYVLTARPVRRIEGVLTCDVTYPKLKASEWIVLAAAAPELPSQQQVSTRLRPGGKDGTDLSALKRPIVWAKVAAGDQQRTRLRYAVTYRATLLERRLVRRPKGKEPPAVRPLSEAEKKWYRAATATFYDYHARPFQAWLDRRGLRIKAGEGAVAFARRVLLAIAGTYTYEARQDDDRRASAVCRAGKSDCGGLSVLFVAALRANHIPARSLVGNWAESAKPGQVLGDIPFTKQHVRAELFAPGVGWVPADPSQTVQLRPKLNREAMLQYCFGYDAGDFLVQQIDYDLVFDTGVFGKKTVPWTWCTAWPVGEGERTGPILEEAWKVRLLRVGR